MENIMFRGKRTKDDNRWVYGNLIQGPKGKSFISFKGNLSFKKDCMFEVDPQTVGQYSGYCDLYDENGLANKIFEGDLICIKNRDTIFEITFKNGCFFVEQFLTKHRNPVPLYVFYAMYSEFGIYVIDNIFDFRSKAFKNFNDVDSYYTEFGYYGNGKEYSTIDEFIEEYLDK